LVGKYTKKVKRQKAKAKKFS